MLSFLWFLVPVFVSCADRPGECTAGNVALTLLPLSIAALGSYVHLVVSDPHLEHIVRHTVFAIGFVLGAPLVDWTFVESTGLHDLTYFFVFTSVSLFAFAIVHYFEWSGYAVRTHYGDVLILPVALIAITTFYDGVAQEVFLLSRSIPVAVLVIVAWNTILLIAFCDFSLRAVTCLHDRLFHMIRTTSMVVSVTHLLLVELRPPPLYYFVWTVASAWLMIFMQPTDRLLQRVPPKSLPRVFVATGVAALAALSFLAILGSGAAFGVAFPVLFFFLTFVQELGLVVHGARWVIGSTPAFLLPFFLVLFHLLREDVPSVQHQALATAILTSGVLSSGLLYALGRVLGLYSYTLPGIPSVPRTYDPVQLRTDTCWNRVRTTDCALPGRTFDAGGTWLHSFLEDSRAKRGDMDGVWWAKDNTVFNYTIGITHYEGETELRGSAGYNFTWSASVWGAVNLGLSLFGSVHSYVRTANWIQVDYVFDFFGLTYLYDTSWIYRPRGSVDEAHRIFYKSGEVVYHYRLLRLAYVVDGAVIKTRYYKEFMNEHKDGKFLSVVRGRGGPKREVEEYEVTIP